ncbi:MAG: GntR family transcriptional regulator [Tissierellia bacterium]|nr:GntR family transcriptional regulator [Tissierellia bacterium]
MSPSPLTATDPPAKNLSEQVYLDLKKRILNLDLKPKTLIKEVDLSQKYDVSRTPAREAIKKLKEESYIAFEPGLGNIVAPFTTRNYTEIYQMREALEVLSVKQATINWSPQDLEALKENVHIQNTLLTSDYEPLKFLYLDREFHVLLAEASQNSFLVTEVGEFYDLFYRYNYYCNFKQRQLFAITEHEKLLKALEARDAYTAAQEMRTHMQNINSLILIALSEDGSVS